MINILIRTSNRPNQFKTCVNSILNQSYQDFKIICCYDDIKSKEYINNYSDKRIFSYFINLDNCYHYKYNLYCNFLLNKVNNGWIMFLDDDDMLSNKETLDLISKYTNSNNNLIFWKVLIKDKEIYPKNLKKISMGEIANSGFCFHSSFKRYSNWICRRGSDFFFIKNLQSKISFNNVLIKKTLVSTQIGANRGKKLTYKSIKDFNITSMFISKQRYKNFFDLKLYQEKGDKPCLFVGINNMTILNAINKYTGYCYVLALNESEIMNLRYVTKKKKIKILLPNTIDQNSYIHFLHQNICLLHYDVIYTDCK